MVKSNSMSSVAKFLLSFLILLSGCSSIPPVANIDSRGSQIVCFGDSLTAGEGAGQGEDYPSRVAAVVTYPVINAGISGDTTEDALARLERDVLSQDPLLVVVILGGNDFLRHYPHQQTFGNLEKIIQRIQGRGAMVVLASVQGGLFGDVYRKDYLRLAKQYKAAFIPNILAGIISNPSLKSDEIHPNAAGYQKMADRIVEAARPLLEENARGRQ